MTAKDDDIMCNLLTAATTEAPDPKLAAQKKDDQALLKGITHTEADKPTASTPVSATVTQPLLGQTQPVSLTTGTKQVSSSSFRPRPVRPYSAGTTQYRKPKARYHKSELMDNVDRTDLLYNVQGENMELKKFNMRLQEQNKVLEVRFANMHKDLAREGLDATIKARPIEKRGTQSSRGGAQQTRQGAKSVRQVGGALRRRLSPSVSFERSIAPPATQMLSDEAEMLRRRVEQLTAENEAYRKLSPRQEAAVSSEAAQCAKEFRAEREQLHNEKIDLMRRVAQLEKEKLETESELRHLKAFDEKSNIQHWKRKVAEYEENNKQLLAKVNALTKNAFLGTADSRVASGKQLDEMELSLKKTVAVSEKVTKEKDTLEAEMIVIKKQHQATLDKYKELLEDNERLRIRLEEKDKQLLKIENQVQYLNQSLPPDQSEALQQALRIIMDGASATFATFDKALIDRSAAGSVPSAVDLAGGPTGTAESALTRVVDRLRSEKDDLAQELTAAKQLLVRESAISRDLKELNRKDAEDMEQRLQIARADKEKWEQIARTREKRLKELQRKVDSARYKDLGATMGAPLDAVSESGFTDVSELKGSENALDVILSGGRIEDSVLARLPKMEGVAALSAATVMTCITVDFFEFDSACTEVGTSLCPNYDSILSFEPFTVDEFFLEYVSSNHTLKCELQALVVGSRTQHVLGVAHWELVDLMIMPSSEKPNPMHTGVLRFVSVADPSLLVAEVPYKIKLRYSILDLVVDYMAKYDLKSKQLAQLSRPLDVDPLLADTYRHLSVRIFQATGLPASSKALYCFYEIPGYPQIFTRTMSVENGVCKIGDDSVVNILVDTKFQDWVQGSNSGLRIVLFEEHSEATGTQEEIIGVFGEVKLDIKSILYNSQFVIEGVFPVRKDVRVATSPQVGSLEVSVSWTERRDMRVAGEEKPSHVSHIPNQGPLSPDYFAIIMLRLSRNIDLRNLTVNDWFAHADTDRDGFLSQDEFLLAIARTSLGLSAEESRYVWSMVDTEKFGRISQAQLARGLAQGAKMSTLEGWAKDLLQRVNQALIQQKQDPRQVFERISVNYRILRPAFTNLLTSLNLQLAAPDIDRVWAMCDANNNGFIDFNEFTNRFGIGNHPDPITTSYVMPTNKGHTAAVATTMTSSYYDICIGRIVRQLQARGIHNATRAFETMDKDHDGTLSRQDLLASLTELHVGLSEWEQVQIYERLDPEHSGFVRLDALSTALLFAAISTSPNQSLFQQANDIFARIGGSIKRSNKSIREVYDALGSTHGISKAQFCQVVLHYDPSLTGVQLDHLWEIVDKNRDGTIDFREFETCFSTTIPNRMSDERFSLIMAKVHKKLTARGFTTIDGVFQAMDKNQDGTLTTKELSNALERLDLGLSTAEREMVAEQMDDNRDGRISILELQNALLSSDIPGRSTDEWAKEIILRIQSAIVRAQSDVSSLFEALVPQKGKAMSHQQFTNFVLKFSPNLSDAQTNRLWYLVDKNSDDEISFKEFENRFAPAPPVPSSVGLGLAQPSTPCPLSTTRSISSSVGEDLTLFQRIQKRAEVSGKALSDLMGGFDTTHQGVLKLKDFVNFIMSLSIGLSFSDTETLFKKFDQGGGVKIADFVHTVDRKTTKLDAWAQALFGRVSSSIKRTGQPISEIFKKFCGGQTVMKREQFEGIMRAFEQDLPQRHVDRLWNLVDNNQSGDIDFTEFREVFDLN